MTTVIAAVDRKNGIGKGNKIPFWSDMAFFKATTIGNLVIMGRRTWESLKEKPLPGRINVIVSTTYDDGRWALSKQGERFYVFHSLGQALDFANKEHSDKEHFVIGGEILYRTAFDQKLVDKVILSKIAVEAECDTFFPLNEAQLREKFGPHKTLGIDNDTPEPVLRLQYAKKIN